MAASTLIWYATCRELLGSRGGWLAAWFFATLFPIVFYAHTTNVEAPLILWTMLAFYGAARVYVRTEDRLGMVLIGAASALAISTKEQAFGFLIWLPLILLVRHIRRRRVEATGPLLPAGAWTGLMVAVGLFVCMNVIFFNPSGFWHRVQFLTHSLPDELRQQYVPYYFPIVFEMPRDLSIEIAQLRRTAEIVADSMGWPLFFAAALGCLMRGWHSSGLFFIIPAMGYYLISGRSFLMLTPRYVLPLTVLATALIAIGLEWTVRSTQAGKPSRAIVNLGIVALIIFAGIRGADATRLLVQDPRYAAERWLQSNPPKGASVEIYQPRTYLPRFPSDIRVSEVPYGERSVAQFLARAPDFVVLSSAGVANVTTKYPRDWQQDHADNDEDLNYVPGASPKARIFEQKSNRLFFDALQTGCLGYMLVHRFEHAPWVAEPIIPGLAPTIAIYHRSDSRQAHWSESCSALFSNQVGHENVGENNG